MSSVTGRLTSAAGWYAIAALPGIAVAVAGWPWIGLALVVVLHLALVAATLWPHSRLFGPVVHELPTTARAVWLTIDDGPSADTRAMLASLARHGAHATFFLVAERARRQPELVRAIVAAGHDIGNHSSTHPAAWFWALPRGRLGREVAEAQSMLEACTGRRPRWFRSVAGHTNPDVPAVLAGHSLTRVSWTVRGFDAVDARVSRVVKRLAAGLRPGAIVLLHEGAAHGRSVATLEATLALLADRGYRTLAPAETAELAIMSVGPPAASY